MAAISAMFRRRAMIAVAATCLHLHTGNLQAQTPHAKYVPQPLVFHSATPADGLLHVLIGRTLFLETTHRLKRVYLTNPALLTSMTATPYQVVITATKPGTSSVILWDETGQSHTYLIESDIHVAALQAALLQAFPASGLSAESAEDQITLRGSLGTQVQTDQAQKLAALYATNVVNLIHVTAARVPQVKLKVRFVEIDRSRLEQFGFNFFSAGGNTLGATTTGQFASALAVSGVSSGSSGSGSGSTVGNKSVSISNPLNFLLYSSQANVGVTLQDLASKQVLQILAEPTIATLSGQKADFLAGGEFPFPVVQGASNGITSVSIQFRPYGVKLEFTPVVNTDGTIDLTVAPEVSALDYTNAVSISGYTIPALSTRRVNTRVVLRSGQSFAVSGLLDKRTTDQLSHTPGIASIPILGALFRSKGVNHSNSELVVIVTPTIVDPLSDANDADVPVEPKTVVAPMNSKTFDDSLPAKTKKQD